jgi:hypothetical protein
MGVQCGVSVSTTCSLDVQGVSLPRFIIAEMPDCPASGFDAVAQLWGHPNLIKDDLNLHLMVDD